MGNRQKFSDMKNSNDRVEAMHLTMTDRNEGKEREIYRM